MYDVDFGIAEKCESQWLTNVYFPSKLGGKPAWLHLGDLPSTDDLKCNKCGYQQSFLCQVYAPFDDEYNFHRMIYVFICRTESCYIANNNENITVLRSQLPLHNEYFPSEPPPEEGEDDAVPEILPRNCKLCFVCGCPGLFKCGQCKMVNYCGTQHQRLHWPHHKLSCSPSLPATNKSINKPIAQILFPEWEIDINTIDIDEKNCTSPKVNEAEELEKFKTLTASVQAESTQTFDDKELEEYAKGCEEFDDKYFEKFRKECDGGPMQIIRYKRNGEILWISDPKHINEQLKSVPKCELCGEARIFEFQIMPQMLNYLKDPNIDWGIIAVYTCPKSCPLSKEKGYVKEFCIKQDICK